MVSVTIDCFIQRCYRNQREKYVENQKWLCYSQIKLRNQYDWKKLLISIHFSHKQKKTGTNLVVNNKV